MAADFRPLVVCGPSGVGKGALCEKLRATNPELFKKSISHTTRAPRHEGEEYYFVSSTTFSDLVAQDAFIETTVYNGHSYGTSKQTLANQRTKTNSIIILDIDIEGAKQLKTTDIDARYVFLKPPSLEALEKRLRGRGSESEEDIQKRLDRAKIELEYAERSDIFDKIIVNNDIETAFSELWEFVVTHIL